MKDIALYQTASGELTPITLERLRAFVNKPEWDWQTWEAFCEYVEFSCSALLDWIEEENMQDLADMASVLDSENIERIQESLGTVLHLELDDEQLIESIDDNVHLVWRRAA